MRREWRRDASQGPPQQEAEGRRSPPPEAGPPRGANPFQFLKALVASTADDGGGLDDDSSGDSDGGAGRTTADTVRRSLSFEGSPRPSRSRSAERPPEADGDPESRLAGAWELRRRGSGVDALHPAMSSTGRVAARAAAATVWIKRARGKWFVHLRDGVISHRFSGPPGLPIRTAMDDAECDRRAFFVDDTLAASDDALEIACACAATGAPVLKFRFALRRGATAGRDALDLAVSRSGPGLEGDGDPGDPDEYARAKPDRALDIELSASG